MAYPRSKLGQSFHEAYRRGSDGLDVLLKKNATLDLGVIVQKTEIGVQVVHIYQFILYVEVARQDCEHPVPYNIRPGQINNQNKAKRLVATEWSFSHGNGSSGSG